MQKCPKCENRAVPFDKKEEDVCVNCTNKEKETRQIQTETDDNYN